jgi:PAS domain S-box-containing protein
MALYTPRMASLQHGFAEPGDVQDIRLVVDTIPTLAWSAGPDGSAEFFNQRWLDYTGLSAKQALDWGWEVAIHPDDLPRILEVFREALNSLKPYEVEGRFRRFDGEFRWFLFRGSPLRDRSGKVAKWYGTNTDLEERKRAEDALRASEASLLEAQRLTRTCSWKHEVLSGKVTVSAEGLAMYGIEPGDDASSTEFYHRRKHPKDRPAVEQAYAAALLRKTEFEADFRIVLPDGTIKNIRSIGHPILDERGDVVEFVGASIDVTEHYRAQQALRRSEAYLAEAQRLAKTGSWAYDPVAEKGIYWSSEMLRMCGLDPQRSDFPDGEEFFRLMHPEDRDRFNELYERSRIQKTDYDADYRIVLPDGAIKHLHVVGHPVLNESGDVVEFVGTAIDFTEHHRAEQALRRSEAYLEEAQKLTHTGSWAAQVSQKENVYWSNVYWSKEMYRIFGLDPGPTPPSPMEVARRLHPEYAPYHPRVVERAIRDGTDFEIDYRLLLPDGAAKYIHVVGHPVVDASGDVIELVGTAMDVTEQHEARAALQTAFEQIKAEEIELRRMIDAVASYISVLRPDGTALYANQTVLDYTGLTLEEVQREDQSARVFHPEDVERLREKRHEALARGKPFELEQRVLGKDGNYRWFLVRYNPLRDDHGDIIRWYATGTDIEDRKRAEERMRNENLALREQIDQAFMFEEIVGSSPALQTVLSNIVKVAPTDSTVLITGETGTGKELIARAIHKHSQRSGQAFITVNCASIPSSLIASELFGHEKGAFTGAVQRRQGRFEMAHSGTIFLDEVGELPAETQIALLRVLQERQFERVGGNRILSTDVRVIAATNRDLTAAIAAGTFRSDLFYRLNVFPIEVPPLRKRKEDIPMLVEYFVKRYAEKAGKQIRKIDMNTLKLCQSYPWPGNIRELQNIVERSMILSSGDTFWIEKAWLASPGPARQQLPSPLVDTLEDQEREIIETALAECKGKVAGSKGAAAKLGIPRSTLDWKIKRLKIKKHKFIPD